MENKGSGLGVVLFVAIVFFVMEYTNFPAQLASMLNAFSAASNPAPATTSPSTVSQVVNAAGQIATHAEAANSSSVQSSSNSVG